MKCFFRTIWYNIRYVKIFLLNGYLADGHNLYYTGEIHDDHWHMKCIDCGKLVASEVGPNTKPVNIK